MKRLTILGATGSIGTQTLDVVRHNRQDFEVIALTASVNVEKMAELILEFSPSYAVMKNEEKAKELEVLIPQSDCTVLYGMEGFVEVSTLPQTEVVVAAMVGMIGLRPVMEAIRAGKDIALANKETLVTAGHIIMPLAKEYGVSLLPVDSEHSAIFQCLNGEKKSQIETIYLTASGGPFRHYTKEQLEDVTVEQALAHPNWFMGSKITIDSATMMNKGLEIIEAKWLFDVDFDKIQVVVHPQSIIHSMVEYVDGAVMAQLGMPDMKLPIQYALFYPNRRVMNNNKLDFYKLGSISFEEPDMDTFSGLKLAYEVGRTGGSLPTVYNAANEKAVELFLNNKIKFLDIYKIIEKCVDKHSVINNPSIEEILEVERKTYDYIKELLSNS